MRALRCDIDFARSLLSLFLWSLLIQYDNYLCSLEPLVSLFEIHARCPSYVTEFRCNVDRSRQNFGL